MPASRAHSTVWLQRESSIYSENSWVAFLGSYYKIYIILRHGELEFCKYIDKSSFQDPVTFRCFASFFTVSLILLSKNSQKWACFKPWDVANPKNHILDISHIGSFDPLKNQAWHYPMVKVYFLKLAKIVEKWPKQAKVKGQKYKFLSSEITISDFPHPFTT